ncbi:MAG: phosphate ABC transporter permease subunit PstC [Solirubrobacterales bacterium 70-9]|nr:MAG: phosphate ABC transporter permease subunit PstC [Solirubrobacterales bacterium 70-9]
MSATPPAGSTSLKLARSNRQSSARKRADRFGDVALRLICLGAAVLAAIVLVLIAKEVIEGAQPAISKFGFSFITHHEWAPPLEKFGGEGLILGTLITSTIALVVGAPVAISIGIFLALLAPTGIRNVISPLVEMLAAIPSVILGFWGLLIFGPFLQRSVEPFLHDTFGFIPLFGKPETTGASVFTASLILTIMVIPIIASVSRDLFMAVPQDLQDGAAALGSTRWEVIRGVVLPSTLSGMIAASLLGLGRALGEAIAVSQVIGGGTDSHLSLFKTGGTMASITALQFSSAVSAIHTASLYYLAALLLVIGVASNLLASWVGMRFGSAGGAMR